MLSQLLLVKVGTSNHQSGFKIHTGEQSPFWTQKNKRVENQRLELLVSFGSDPKLEKKSLVTGTAESQRFNLAWVCTLQRTVLTWQGTDLVEPLRFFFASFDYL